MGFLNNRSLPNGLLKNPPPPTPIPAQAVKPSLSNNQASKRKMEKYFAEIDWTTDSGTDSESKQGGEEVMEQ